MSTDIEFAFLVPGWPESKVAHSDLQMAGLCVLRTCDAAMPPAVHGSNSGKTFQKLLESFNANTIPV